MERKSARQSAAGFGDLVKGAVKNVHEAQKTADRAMTDLATGNRRTLHETMIQVEKSNLQFRLMMSVRHKLIQAYQEISRMNF
jgi:flagellar hook-basal body complex protein FliE